MPTALAADSHHSHQPSAIRIQSAVATDEVRDLLTGIHQQIAAVRHEHSELRAANSRLEAVVADGLLTFVKKIDAQSFKVICAVLACGDIAKAARELRQKDSTLRDFITKWKTRGKPYAVLADLVRWRKQMRLRGTVPLNDAILNDHTPNTDYEALLSDVLDGLLSMTNATWQVNREELAALLRSAAG